MGTATRPGLFSGGKTWTQIVADGLAAKAGEVGLQEMSFLVISRTAPARVEARVREMEPDLVILPVGTYLWTVGFVAKRVRGLLGERIGRLYKRAEDRFDARTWKRGALRDRANRVARSVVRRTIGVSPLATQAETTEAIRSVLATLARMEHVQVVVACYPPESPNFLRGNLRERRDRFMADVERATRERHFTWISGDVATAEAQVTEPITTPDGFHFNELGHRIHGEYVLREIIVHVDLPARTVNRDWVATTPSGSASRTHP